ncbi:hypothetical protein FQN55_004974, partial [Onygenales sp. PD_40]
GMDHDFFEHADQSVALGDLSGPGWVQSCQLDQSNSAKVPPAANYHGFAELDSL